MTNGRQNRTKREPFTDSRGESSVNSDKKSSKNRKPTAKELLDHYQSQQNIEELKSTRAERKDVFEQFKKQSQSKKKTD